jgi:hypothetical protein
MVEGADSADSTRQGLARQRAEGDTCSMVKYATLVSILVQRLKATEKATPKVYHIATYMVSFKNLLEQRQ